MWTCFFDKGRGPLVSLVLAQPAGGMSWPYGPHSSVLWAAFACRSSMSNYSMYLLKGCLLHAIVVGQVNAQPVSC